MTARRARSRSAAFLDFREYLPTTQRSGFAFRVFVGYSDGDFPQPFYFGGFDTVRGFEFRELVGDRAFYGNLEWRFPLIDLLATPVLAFQGIRGRIFFDIGGAWFDEVQDFDAYDSDESRLEDAVSAYGVGITFQFFGLNLNWDFAKTWDFETVERPQDQLLDRSAVLGRAWSRTSWN